MVKLKVILESSWSKTAIREFDDDSSKTYVDYLGGGHRMIENKEDATVILSEGIENYVNSRADGGGDETGSYSIGVKYIMDNNGNILYSHSDEPMGKRNPHKYGSEEYWALQKELNAIDKIERENYFRDVEEKIKDYIAEEKKSFPASATTRIKRTPIRRMLEGEDVSHRNTPLKRMLRGETLKSNRGQGGYFRYRKEHSINAKRGARTRRRRR